MNKIILIGNFGKDPEMSYTQSGMAVTHFSLAVRRISTKIRRANAQDETIGLISLTWSKLAETINQYLKKGQKVYVEGRLQSASTPIKAMSNVLRSMSSATIWRCSHRKWQSGSGFRAATCKMAMMTVSETWMITPSNLKENVCAKTH